MPNEKDLNRRDFLITGAAGLTALGSAAFLGRPGLVMGANDRVRVAHLRCTRAGRGSSPQLLTIAQRADCRTVRH